MLIFFRQYLAGVFFIIFILKVLRCSNIAVVKVTEITELIQKALLNDKKERLVSFKWINESFEKIFTLGNHSSLLEPMLIDYRVELCL